MSGRLRDVLMQELDTLRHEPTEKRIRAVLDGETVVDSTAAVLVWEPRRIVPSYAVPVADVHAALAPADDGDGEVPDPAPAVAIGGAGGRPVPVLDPRVPFSVHTAEGEPLRIDVGRRGRAPAAFRPVDESLAGYVILDFAGFDAWYEEDEPNVGHPRDPFHRIDILHSSRHARVSLDGRLLAESRRPTLLFEPPLPVRCYLPSEDVQTDLLRPSDTRTFCAYKGRASYWSLEGEPDVAWSYPEPLREAREIAGLIAFFDERVEVELEGRAMERPLTPWSPR